MLLTAIQGGVVTPSRVPNLPSLSRLKEEKVITLWDQTTKHGSQHGETKRSDPVDSLWALVSSALLKVLWLSRAIVLF